MGVVRDIFDPTCGHYHPARVARTLDADGFPQRVDWIERCSSSEVRRGAAEERDRLLDLIASEGGAAMGIALDTGRWSLIEEVADRVLRVNDGDS